MERKANRYAGVSRSPLSLDEVLSAILNSLFDTFEQVDRGFVVLQGPEPGTLVPKSMKLRRGDSEDPIRLSRTIVRKSMDGKEAILSADVVSETHLDSSKSIADFRIRSTMCAPLLSAEGDAMGAIWIDTLDQRMPFTPDDLDLLARIINKVAIVVERALGTTSSSSDTVS